MTINKGNTYFPRWGVVYFGEYRVAIYIDFNSYGNENTQQWMALAESTVDTFQPFWFNGKLFVILVS